MQRISYRTREKVENFIKKNKVVYFSEVRALQKKKKDQQLIPKVTFTSLVQILSDLEKENTIAIQKIGSVKIITWVKNQIYETDNN